MRAPECRPAAGARPHGEADAELCEGLSQARQERRQRCSGNLRGSGAAIDAVCSDKDAGTTDWPDAAPDPTNDGTAAHDAFECDPRHMAELGIISAKGRNGTVELLQIIGDVADDRIPSVARFCLDLLARQYLTLNAEVSAIQARLHA